MNDVELKVATSVENNGELKKLSAEIIAMGGDASETSEEAEQLGAALEALGKKQAAIDAFVRQKKATEDASAAMAAASKKAQELGKALSETENASKKQTTEFEKAKKAARDTADAYEKQQVALQNSRTTLKEAGISTSNLAQAQIDVTKSTRDAAKAQEELVGSTRERVAEVKKTVAAEEVAAQAAKDRAAAEVKAAAEATAAEESRTRAIVESAAAQQKAFQDIAAGSAKIAAVSVPFVGMVKSAVDFNSVMTDVAKVVDGTDAQIASLAERIKQLSMIPGMPIANDLAKMAEAGGQLGVPIEKLEQFILLAAKMGTAFNMSGEEAGQAVAKLANVFNMPLESVSSLGDAINLLGNTTAAREADIIDVLTRVGGSAVQFGLTAEQVSALAATMLSLGMTSEVASTGISAMLSKLQTANVQGDDFQDALGKMGVSANQLAADIRANPQQALTKFLSTLKDLDSQARAEIVTKLFGLEYQDDIARMVGSLDQYQSALQKVGDQANYAGAMQTEFDKRAATTESQLKRLENSINTVSINLGSIFLPAVNSSADSMAGLTSALAEFIQQNPALAGMATSIGAVGVAGDGLLQVMTGLSQAGITSFSQISGAIQFAQRDMSALAGSASTTADKLAAAGAIAAAGWIGWNIGASLKEQFIEVETFGIDTAQIMTDLAARIKYAFDILATPIDGNMFDHIGELTKNLDAELIKVELEYGALREAAIAAREPMVETPKAAAVAIDEMTVALDQAVAAEAKLNSDHTKKLAEEAAKTAAAYKEFGITSLQSLNDSAQGAATLYANMVQAKAPAYELDQAYAKMVETQLKAAAAQGQAALDAKLKMFETTAATDSQRAVVAKLTAEYAKLNASTTITKNSLGEMADRVRATNPNLAAMFDAASKAAPAVADIGTAATQSAGEVSALDDVLKQVASAKTQTDLANAGDALRESFNAGKISSEDYAKALSAVDASSRLLRQEIAVAATYLDGMTESIKKQSAQIWLNNTATAEINREMQGLLETVQGGNMDSATAELEKQNVALRAQAESARQAASEWSHMADITSRIGGADYVGAIVAQARMSEIMAEQQIRANELKIAQDNLAGAMRDIKSAADNGSLSLVDQANKLDGLRDQYSYLNDTDLSGLRSEIDAVNGKIQSAIDAANSLRDSLLQEQARAAGDDATAVEIENRRKIADIEKQINEARAAGNDEALRVLQESLQIQQSLASAAEREARAKMEAAKQSGGATKTSTTGGSSGTGGLAPTIDTKAITDAIRSAQAGTTNITVTLDGTQIASKVTAIQKDQSRRGLN